MFHDNNGFNSGYRADKMSRDRITETSECIQVASWHSYYLQPHGYMRKCVIIGFGKISSLDVSIKQFLTISDLLS